jgi:hypothetical protein
MAGVQVDEDAAGGLVLCWLFALPNSRVVARTWRLTYLTDSRPKLLETNLQQPNEAALYHETSAVPNP